MTTRSVTAPQCLVCGESSDSIHFGAQSCRACAAFFRRKVASNQKVKKNCEGNCSLNDQVLRRFCAFCRFEKCQKVGMNPILVLSRGPVPSPDCSMLSSLKEVYEKLVEARATTYGLEKEKTSRQMNYQDLREMHDTDKQLIQEHLLPFFQLKSSKPEHKKVLDKNFVAPFVLLESAFRSQDSANLILPNGDFVDTSDLTRFYQNPEDPNDEKAKNAESLLKPYWTMNDTVLRQQLRDVRLEMNEFLLLTAFVYWDSGISQLPDQIVDICDTKRSQIVSELTNYEKEKRGPGNDSFRVGEVMMVLQAVQRNMHLIYECREISLVYDLSGRACPLSDTL